MLLGVAAIGIFSLIFLSGAIMAPGLVLHLSGFPYADRPYCPINVGDGLAHKMKRADSDAAAPLRLWDAVWSFVPASVFWVGFFLFIGLDKGVKANVTVLFVGGLVSIAIPIWRCLKSDGWSSRLAALSYAIVLWHGLLLGVFIAALANQSRLTAANATETLVATTVFVIVFALMNVMVAQARFRHVPIIIAFAFAITIYLFGQDIFASPFSLLHLGGFYARLYLSNENPAVRTALTECHEANADGSYSVFVSNALGQNVLVSMRTVTDGGRCFVRISAKDVAALQYGSTPTPEPSPTTVGPEGHQTSTRQRAQRARFPSHGAGRV